MKFIILTILSSFIVSCSTLSQKECQIMNWLEIGKSDGLEGKEIRRFSTYVESKACIKYDTKIQDQYAKGHTQGIKLFCTKKNWFETGKSDGVEGKDTNTFSTHPESKVCIMYDVTTQDQYEKGRVQGIKLFCTKKNWFETGKSDGLEGRGTEAFSRYYKKCIEYNTKVYKSKYERGRVQGIKLFCTYNKGYTFGLSGKRYTNTCPKKLENNFLKGYQIGKGEYNQEQMRRAMEEESRRAAERELRAIRIRHAEIQQRAREEQKRRAERQQKAWQKAWEEQKRRAERQQRAREEQRRHEERQEWAEEQRNLEKKRYEEERRRRRAIEDQQWEERRRRRAIESK